MAPVTGSAGKGKGKHVDQSTPWSDNKWDESRKAWYVDRFNSFGVLEYKYYNPEANEASSESTPRTTSDSSWGSHEQSSIATNNQDVHYTTASSSASDHDQPDTEFDRINEDLEVADTSYVPVSRDDSSFAGPSNSSRFQQDEQDRFSQSFQALSFSSSIPEEGPAEPASILEQRIASAKRIRRQPNSKSYEELDDRYRVVEDRKQKNFWKVGRCFMMLWTEPARTQQPQVPPHGGTRNGSHLSTVYLNGTAYSEIRRFVVISVGHGSNICSPIQTYSGQGTLKANLPEADQHAIIHTTKYPPNELGYSGPNGEWIKEDLVKDPIRVRSERKDLEGTLHEASRLNYSKIYTVENYVRVLNIGMVHENSMASLISNCLVKPRAEPTPPRADRGGSSHRHRRN